MNKKFNVGDTVILTTPWQGRHICTVERITSAGNIAISGLKNTLFKPNGRERGGDTYSCRYIHPASPDEIADLEQQQYINDVKRKMEHILKNLTYEQAKELFMTSMFQKAENDIESDI
jgi:hypothetical protein